VPALPASVSPAPVAHRLQDRVAVVTGAAHGIGRSIAERLAAEGALLVLNDIDADGVRKATGAIDQSGTRAVAAPGDVRLAADTDAMVAAAERAFGKLDILVNNAGVVRGGPIHQISDDAWDLVLDVILRGAFNACRSSARLLGAIDGGRATHNRKVVNISSIAGVHGGVGGANYSAAKAGLIGLSKTLAREWAPHRINVNVIAPGRIAGTLIGVPRDTEGRPRQPERQTADQPSIPIGRVGTPEDVAALTAFLAAPESDYLTGQVIELHGGLEFLGRS
jgi:3-oxoacyl-[acyl-carrier protein] reductase